LNMGNAGNVEAMNNEYTPEQQRAVMATLTDKDWNVVEAIWAHIDTYWKDLSALEERTTGVMPAKVDAVPFTTPGGRQVTGGYYPLAADPNRSDMGKKDMEERASLQGFLGGGHTKATTKSGSTIERVGFGNRRFVLLDLSVAFQHVDGVIKDIELREAVVTAHRIINSKSFEEAVTAAKGKQFHQMYQKWIENVIGVNQPQASALESVIGYARTGASIAEMGLSLRTMLQQPFGITQTIVMIGEMNTYRGVAEFARDRTTAVRKVMEMSPFMANRAATFNRDVRDAHRMLGVQGLQENITTAAFWGIQKLDMAVAIPTWLGAHQKAVAEGMGPQDAIDYADGIVSRSQGTGLPRDMADIVQGARWKKLFTMFYSFFSAYQNLQTDQWKQTSFRDAKQALRWAKNQVWITLIPSLLIDYLFNKGPDDDDPESWLKWGGASVAKFAFGGIVGVRDAVNATASGFSFKTTPAQGMLENPIRLTHQTAQILFDDGDVDAAWLKALVMTAGYVGHVPGARQTSRAIDVIDDEGFDNLDEFETWWRILVQGKER